LAGAAVGLADGRAVPGTTADGAEVAVRGDGQVGGRSVCERRVAGDVQGRAESRGAADVGSTGSGEVGGRSVGERRVAGDVQGGAQGGGTGHFGRAGDGEKRAGGGGADTDVAGASNNQRRVGSTTMWRRRTDGEVAGAVEVDAGIGRAGVKVGETIWSSLETHGSQTRWTFNSEVPDRRSGTDTDVAGRSVDIEVIAVDREVAGGAAVEIDIETATGAVAGDGAIAEGIDGVRPVARSVVGQA